MPLGLQTFVQSFYRDFFIDYDTVSIAEGENGHELLAAHFSTEQSKQRRV
jgi:hypothetical protein